MRRRIHQPLGVRVLGRLPALTLFGWFALGCDDAKKPEATRERSQVVTAASPTSSAPRPPASAPTRPKSPARKLCQPELDEPRAKAPDRAISRRQAPGEPELPEKLALGGGAHTWINFWAAWCAPCKEELPRLLAFEKKLKQSGRKFRLVFVSLDDDMRQLDEFLKAQGEGGLRRTYVLAEGKERKEWLKAAEIEEDPELPTHLLVDPDGKLRCRVRGALEDSDYTSLAELVAR